MIRDAPFSNHDGVDRSVFSSVFDNVSCLGFYTCDTIGPMPSIVSPYSGIFNGSATIMPDTVVRAMIVAEKNDYEDVKNCENDTSNDFDDHEDNVNEYTKKRLLTK